MTQTNKRSFDQTESDSDLSMSSDSEIEDVQFVQENNKKLKQVNSQSKSILPLSKRFFRSSIRPSKQYIFLTIETSSPSISFESCAQLYNFLQSPLVELHGTIGAATMPISILEYNDYSINQNKSNSLSLPFQHDFIKRNSQLTIKSGNGFAAAILIIDSRKSSHIRSGFMLYGKHSSQQSSISASSKSDSRRTSYSTGSNCHINVVAQSAFLPTLMHSIE